MANVTYDDMFELVDEIERGAKDKTRTLDSVTNSTVKGMLVAEVSMAHKAGVISAIVGGCAATGALIGTIGGAGTGAVSAGLTTLGVTAFTVTAGGATGATLGSAVPIVGTIIGAAVGVGVGMFIGSQVQKENDKKKALLRQKVLEKQNRCIRDLEKELDELRKKYGEAVKQNERFKYIISLLMSNEEIKKAI